MDFELEMDNDGECNLIPDIIACFEPDENIIFLNIKNEIPERMIFEIEGKYRDFEEQYLEELDKVIQKSEHSKDITKIFNRANKLRFLQGAHYDYKDTIDSMIEHIEFLKHVSPKVLSDKVLENIARGVYYITGRDKCFRLVGVFRASFLTILKTDDTTPSPADNSIAESNGPSNTFDDLFNAALHFIDNSIKFMTVPGKVENFVNIIDLLGVSATKLPIKYCIKIIDTLQKHYKCRVYKTIGVGVGFGIKLVWKIIYPFVDIKLREKVILLGDNELNKLKTYIHPKQLEKRFGGDIEEITDFWPPKIFSEEYGHDQKLINIQDKNNKLDQLKNNLKEYHHTFEYNINKRLSEMGIDKDANLKDYDHIVMNTEGELEFIRPSNKINFDEVIDLQSNAKLRSYSAKTQISGIDDKECCCMIF